MILHLANGEFINRTAEFIPAFIHSFIPSATTPFATRTSINVVFTHLSATHREADDTYFKIKRPGHNLDRCTNQFGFVRAIEDKIKAMEEVVAGR